ncbi:MAG TPA: 16S rRNA (guanine(966)-N(2))-methyltransferase RsmD [Tepidisphaeraceae bacterium]|jgi:16S rRNA (guanine966-N2)-methyltransferase
MRIIAGEFRSRTLLAPTGVITRPITDRVKQSVFDIVNPWLENAVIYDLFAGTGSLGLECLSRGAISATFFESDPSALDHLQKNIANLSVQPRSKIVKTDIFKWFATAPKPQRPADVIFLDPPYAFLKSRPDDLKTLSAQIATTHLAPKGLVVFRHDIADNLDLPPLQQLDIRDYGSMRVQFLTHPMY